MVAKTVELGLSRSLLAAQQIARDLITRPVGGRLPTAAEYQRLCGFGSGTIQKALADLQSVGAVELRARGHRGTFLLDRDLGRLWSLSGLGPVTAVLPLPNCSEWAGLATGLRQEFKRLGIPLQAVYIHGAYARARLVAEGEADLAVMSEGAAQELLSSQLTIASRLWPCSYYSADSVVVLWRPGLNEPAAVARPGTDTQEQPGRGGGYQAVRRVGIDRNSYDHTQLTLAEFPAAQGSEYEYVQYDYPYLPAAVARGEVDVAVWHRTALGIPIELVGIKTSRLRNPSALTLSNRLSRAVIVSHPGRIEISSLLGEIDWQIVRDVQQKVLDQQMLPIY